jgi:hypothetical protein
MIKYIFSVAFLLGLNDISQGQNRPSVELNLTMPTANVSKFQDFKLKLIITSADEKNVIVFPYCFRFLNQADSIINPDAIFKVEQFVSGYYKQLPVKIELSEHPGLPCIDSSGKEMFDTLSKKNSLIETKNIFPYYFFKKGKYRVRVNLNTNKIDCLKAKSIYSNWVYFSVLKSKIDLSGLEK